MKRRMRREPTIHERTAIYAVYGLLSAAISAGIAYVIIQLAK